MASIEERLARIRPNMPRNYTSYLHEVEIIKSKPSLRNQGENLRVMPYEEFQDKFQLFMEGRTLNAYRGKRSGLGNYMRDFVNKTGYQGFSKAQAAGLIESLKITPDPELKKALQGKKRYEQIAWLRLNKEFYKHKMSVIKEEYNAMKNQMIYKGMSDAARKQAMKEISNTIKMYYFASKNSP